MGLRSFGCRGFWFRDLGFRDLGFRVYGLGFRDLGFRVYGLGFRDLGFRVYGSGFRDLGLRYTTVGVVGGRAERNPTRQCSRPLLRHRSALLHVDVQNARPVFQRLIIWQYCYLL